MLWLLAALVTASAAPPAPEATAASERADVATALVFKPTTFEVDVPRPEVTVLLSRSRARAPAPPLPEAPGLARNILRDAPGLP